MSTVPPFAFDVPAVWDATLNTCDAPEVLAQQFEDAATPVRARRYLSASVATRDPGVITRALTVVDSTFVSSAQGARLMALGQLGQPEAIHAAPEVTPASLTPLDLEDACDQAMARGMAARSLRRWDVAHAQLSIALFLARSLGMRHREQHAMLELAAVLTVQGRPRPELIEEAMGMPIPTSARRRAYAAETLAEACLAVGDYARARRLVARTDGLQTDLWAFASALLGDTLARDAQVQTGRYTPLAEALWALREGREMTMPPMTPHSPEAEYGALLRGAAMLTSRAMVRQARRTFEVLDPITPDQRVWQLAGLIHAAGLTGGEPDVLSLMRQFREALGALRTQEYILPLLRAVMPEAYLLLGLLPQAHPAIEDTLVELPVLCGEGVRHRYTLTKLPGRAAGSAVLVRSAATGESKAMHRQARERLRTALDGLGHREVLNLGVVIRALVMLRAAAPSAERPEWDRALAHALTWLDSDVLCDDIERDLAAQGKAA